MAQAVVEWGGLRGVVGVATWKSSRDAGVVKQDRDFSCGAASLATLLNGYYGQHVTEEEILQSLGKGDSRASFDDMARLLAQRGFRGVGYAASYEQLAKLRMPVVVFLKHRRDTHFSVLRGIDADTVLLADPSQGNRTYSREQFLEMWSTRGDSHLHGSFLAVLPPEVGVKTLSNFFSRTPHRRSEAAVAHQQFQFRPLW